MKKNNELNFKDLKNICDPKNFKFKTTDELAYTDTVIVGQERGLNSLEFATQIGVNGYNIFVEGQSGIGKTTYAKTFLTEKALKMDTPLDWCYVYNFDNPNEPISISFTAGEGVKFQEMMNNFIEDVQTDIKKTFKTEDFEKEKKLIQQDFEKERTNLLENLNKETMTHGFKVETSANGIYMMPVIDGATVDEADFDKLDPKIKEKFEAKSGIVQEQVMKIITEIKTIERASKKKVDEWQSNLALLTVNIHVNGIKNAYKKNKKIATFLDNVKLNVLKNIPKFIDADKACQIKPTTPMQKQDEITPWMNYRVNLFIDNSKTKGAPVIYDSNYSFGNIFGLLEYENNFGSLKTDYTMIKPGLLHKANGGYIIFQAKDLVQNPLCYEHVKKALRNHELVVETPVDPRTSNMMISIKPEPIPLNIKVVLVGDSSVYHGLLSGDDDFRKLFKAKVEFEDTAPRTNANIQKIAQFIHSFCKREDFPQLNTEAVAKIVEYSSRLSGDKEKLSIQFNQLAEIVGEACTWAKLSKEKIVTKEYIQKALDERMERLKRYDQKYIEMIKDNALLISTKGKEVGEINGLTVMSIGNNTFGKPTKITVNTYSGKQGLMAIEREVNLSGPSHSKGILILSGYIGELFAQERPLSLTASICFEQLYGGVDGDSASSTELYAILSSLTGMPISQSIAVTGSVNQKGKIQPIGGVNEKIEGFYQICKMRKLTGEQGVVIPIQNVRNLNLSDEVIQSVKIGEFHIYAISTIEEGIEILTGVPAGKKDKYGNFPAGSINHLANEKLKEYSKYSK